MTIIILLQMRPFVALYKCSPFIPITRHIYNFLDVLTPYQKDSNFHSIQTPLLVNSITQHHPLMIYKLFSSFIIHSQRVQTTLALQYLPFLQNYKFVTINSPYSLRSLLSLFILKVYYSLIRRKLLFLIILLYTFQCIFLTNILQCD